MGEFEALAGRVATFTKTVSEADVYAFAGISGDFYKAHVDAAAMATTPYGQRIAHGALLMAFMSAASTRLIDRVLEDGETSTPVSLGYDRVRFVAPVFFGDTVTVRYEVTMVDREQRRTTALLAVTNQSGATVAVSTHILKWLEPGGAA